MTTLTVALDDMAHGGEAVGHVDGKAIFVPLGIPGETVRVEVAEERSRFSRARLVELLEPSPDRVEPPCPYFGRCGGCQWQHIAYVAQLRTKEHIVRSLLERIGGQAETLVRPTLPMDSERGPWGYRSHVQLVPASADSLGGYRAHGSHDVVPVDECLIAHPLMRALWPAASAPYPGLERVSLRTGTATGERMVIYHGRPVPARRREEAKRALAFSGGESVSYLYDSGRGHIATICGRGHFREVLSGRRFRISGASFFQVNTAQAERLLEVVRQYLALQPEDALLDAYCGVGTFALSLASQASRVWGIENSPWSIRDAKANDAERQVTFLRGDVERVLAHRPIACDALVLDPPRAGCSSKALRALISCQPSRIAYVSCDPATLARDVSRLDEAGYALREVQPVDMFPQTYHIESVALLTRR